MGLQWPQGGRSGWHTLLWDKENIRRRPNQAVLQRPGQVLGQGSELIPVPAVWQLPSPSGESPQSPPTHTGMQSAAYLGILAGKNDKGITEGPLSWGTQSTLDT